MWQLSISIFQSELSLRSLICSTWGQSPGLNICNVTKSAVSFTYGSLPFIQQRNSLGPCREHNVLWKEMEYLDSLAILLLALSLLGILFVLAIGIIFTRNLNTPVVKSSGELMVRYVILFCHFLNFAGTGFFIREPQSFTCKTRQTLSGMSFTLSISYILMKSLKILLAFSCPSCRTSWSASINPSPSFSLARESGCRLHPLAHLCSPCCGTECLLAQSHYLWMWGGVHSCIWLHAGLCCHPGLHVLHLCLQRQEIPWELQWGQIHNIWHAHLLHSLDHLHPHLPRLANICWLWRSSLF